MPTIGRTKLLSRVIHSVLAQSYSDYEFLLIDNDPTSTTEQFWYKEILPYIDERFRYIRYSTTLNQVAGVYEFTFQQATGDYLISLADKTILSPHALEDIAGMSMNGAIPAFSYMPTQHHSDIYQEKLLNLLPTPPLEFGQRYQGEKPQVINSLNTIHGLSTFTDPNQINSAPCTYRTVFRRDLIEHIRSTYGSLFGVGIDADNRLAYRVLDVMESHTIYPNHSLTLTCLNAAVTDSFFYATKNYTTYREFLEKQHPRARENISRSPFGSMALVTHTFLCDFYAAVAEARGLLEGRATADITHFANYLRGNIQSLGDDDLEIKQSLFRSIELTEKRLGSGPIPQWIMA